MYLKNLVLGMFVFLALTLESKAQQVFRIVSAENCQTNANGTHSQCRFPAINISDPELRILPIPYETVVSSHVSRSCNLNAINGALQIRLGKRGNVEENFLRYEDFTMNHNHRKIIIHPNSYPLGIISVSPRVGRIFQDIVFPPNCRINIKVTINRMALKSLVEADEHLRILNQQVASLNRTHRALSELQRQQRQLGDNSSVVSRIRSLFRTADRATQLEALRQQWQGLNSPIRSSLEDARRLGLRIESLSDVIEQLTDFTDLLDQAIAAAQTPADLDEILGLTNNNSSTTQPLFQETHLNELTQAIADAQANIVLARQYFMVTFSEANFGVILDREFKRVFRAELLGPHGVIDEYFHDLSRISTATDFDAVSREIVGSEDERDEYLQNLSRISCTTEFETSGMDISRSEGETDPYLIALRSLRYSP
jgi:hypothetical protein